MIDAYIGIYEAVIEQASGDLILFFVIMAIVLTVFVAPLYYAILKDRRAQRAHELERDEKTRQHEREGKQQIIDVIERNITIMTSLKTTLDSNGDLHVKALDRIHTRIDSTEMIQKAMATDIVQISTKLDASEKNQIEMSSKINKILVIASGGNLPRG